MSDMKCPVCGKPMKEQIDGTCMSYQETDCICNVAAPKIIWKEMAALRKKHNIFTKSMCMEKEFAEAECVRLQNELERTRKALDIAVKRLGYIKNNYKSWTPDRDAQMIAQAVNGLDEIKTALEQKDVK